MCELASQGSKGVILQLEVSLEMISSFVIYCETIIGLYVADFSSFRIVSEDSPNLFVHTTIILVLEIVSKG